MVDSAGIHVPDVQLRNGDLPFRGRPGIGCICSRILPGSGAALPVPPFVREGAAGLSSARVAEGLRLGTDHVADGHVLAQGRRHNAAPGGGSGVGDGLCHNRWWLLRLLRPPGQTCPGGASEHLDVVDVMNCVLLPYARCCKTYLSSLSCKPVLDKCNEPSGVCMPPPFRFQMKCYLCALCISDCTRSCRALLKK